MSCHLDDCELTYRAYCSRCQWHGADCATVREAVLSCQKHNRMRRHIPGHKGYAHVRVVHHHSEATLGQENQDDRASPTRPVESHRTSSRWAWRQDSCS